MAGEFSKKLQALFDVGSQVQNARICANSFDIRTRLVADYSCDYPYGAIMLLQERHPLESQVGVLPLLYQAAVGDAELTCAILDKPRPDNKTAWYAADEIKAALEHGTVTHRLEDFPAFRQVEPVTSKAGR